MNSYTYISLEKNNPKDRAFQNGEMNFTVFTDPNYFKEIKELTGKNMYIIVRNQVKNILLRND